MSGGDGRTEVQILAQEMREMASQVLNECLVDNLIRVAKHTTSRSLHRYHRASRVMPSFNDKLVTFYPACGHVLAEMVHVFLPTSNDISTLK